MSQPHDTVNGIHFLFFGTDPVVLLFTVLVLNVFKYFRLVQTAPPLTEAHSHVLFILSGPFVYLSCMSCDVAPLFSPILSHFCLNFLLMVLAATWDMIG